MAINKNFVIKNGVEVNTNLLVGDSTLNKVGIATTVPGYTLHIGVGDGARGGIGATDITVTGIATIGVANSTSGALSVTGISTFEGLVDANGGVSARTAAVQDLTDNRVVIAGSSGEIEDDANFTYDGVGLNIGAGTGVTVFNNGNVTAAGIGTFNGTAVTLTALATNTAGLTVATATSLDLPALANGTGKVTATAATSFSAPIYAVAETVDLAAGAAVTAKSIAAIGNISDLATISALTLGEQDASLDLSTAVKMVTLDYTAKAIAAGGNAAEATDLTVAHLTAASSLTTVSLAGGMDTVSYTHLTLPTKA